MVLGFEQANRYTVLDQDGNTVALLAEDQGSLGKAVGRQLLRTRRSFTATVFSPDGGYCLHSTTHPISGTLTRQDITVWYRHLSCTQRCSNATLCAVPNSQLA